MQGLPTRFQSLDLCDHVLAGAIADLVPAFIMGDGVARPFTLVSATTASTGVQVNRYERAR